MFRQGGCYTGPVDIAAFVVSLFAVVIAGGALWYARLNDEREQRRVEREDADAHASEEARPSAGYLGRGTSGDHRRAYRFRVTNIGRADARDLEASLIDLEGNVVSPHNGPNYLVDGTGLLETGKIDRVRNRGDR